MKPLFGIPDIHDSLAREKYPSDLSNFQTRIAQAIVRNKQDKIFISSKQFNSLRVLADFYRDRNLDCLAIGEEQIEPVQTQKGEFLAESILRTYTPKDLKTLLGDHELTPYNNSPISDHIVSISGSQILRSDTASSIINNKSIAQRELRNIGIPTPEGKHVESQQEALEFFDYLKSKKYSSVALKRDDSLNGMGVFKVSSRSDFLNVLDENKDVISEKGVLIDGWIEGKIASPNVQFYVGKTSEEDKYICCSEQILVDGGKEHIGNISDESFLFRSDFQEILPKILDWIRGKRAYGVVGIDFLVTKNEIFFIEINGRYNGSTHGAQISQKLGKQYWATHDGISNQELNFHDFTDRLERDALLYKNGAGVLPVNPGTIHLGKAMVVVIGDTPKRVQEILDSLIL